MDEKKPQGDCEVAKEIIRNKEARQQNEKLVQQYEEQRRGRDILMRMGLAFLGGFVAGGTLYGFYTAQRKSNNNQD